MPLPKDIPVYIFYHSFYMFACTFILSFCVCVGGTVLCSSLPNLFFACTVGVAFSVYLHEC